MLVEDQKRKTQFFAQKTNELFFNEIESIRQKKIKRLSQEESTHTHTHNFLPRSLWRKRGKTFHTQQHQHQKLSKQGVLP